MGMKLLQVKIGSLVTSALMALFLVCFLSGCGSDHSALVNLYDLQKVMLAADNSLPDMSSVNGSAEDAGELFEYLSGMPYDKVENYFLTYSSEGKAEEIAVIAVKDAADTEEAKKSLEEHVQNRIKLYQQYEPTQVERVQKALVLTNGRYAVLIICNNTGAVRTAFENFIAGTPS